VRCRARGGLTQLPADVWCNDGEAAANLIPNGDGRDLGNQGYTAWSFHAGGAPEGFGYLRKPAQPLEHYDYIPNVGSAPVVPGKRHELSFWIRSSARTQIHVGLYGLGASSRGLGTAETCNSWGWWAPLGWERRSYVYRPATEAEPSGPCIIRPDAASIRMIIRLKSFAPDGGPTDVDLANLSWRVLD
jgi:hypothetical protein